MPAKDPAETPAEQAGREPETGADAASAEAAVVLHGFSGCGAAMADITGPLGEHLSVIAPDLTGHGANICAESRAYGIDGMADSVAARIAALDTAALDTAALAAGRPAGGAGGGCHLIGYSMGGRVALTLAVRRPELVRSLTLVSASPGLADDEQRRARAELDDRRAEQLAADPQGFFDDWLRQPLFAGLERLGADWRERSLALRLANDPAAMARALRLASPGRMRFISPQTLCRLTVPAAVVAGGNDHAYCRIAERLARVLPCARLTIVPGAGHAVHAEAPEAVVDAVLEVVRASRQVEM